MQECCPHLSFFSHGIAHRCGSQSTKEELEELERGQHRSLHRCLPQLFLWPQGLSQVNFSFSVTVLKHSTFREVDPQRHFWVTRTRHEEQTPEWHTSRQQCDPQGRILPQICEQVGIGSLQLCLSSFKLVLPQQHVLILPGSNSHSPHGPGWQISWQT